MGSVCVRAVRWTRSLVRSKFGRLAASSRLGKRPRTKSMLSDSCASESVPTTRKLESMIVRAFERAAQPRQAFQAMEGRALTRRDLARALDRASCARRLILPAMDTMLRQQGRLPCAQRKSNSKRPRGSEPPNERRLACGLPLCFGFEHDYSKWADDRIEPLRGHDLGKLTA